MADGLPNDEDTQFLNAEESTPTPDGTKFVFVHSCHMHQPYRLPWWGMAMPRTRVFDPPPARMQTQ